MIDHLSFILSSLIIQIIGVTSSFIFQNSLLPWGTKLLSLSIFKIACIHLFTMSLGYCKQQGNHRTWKESRGKWGREAGYYCCQPHFGPRDILSISSFVWGGANPLGREWSPLWLSYICAKLYQSQDAKTGRAEKSRAEKPSCWRAQIWQVLFAQPLPHTKSVLPEAVQATPQSLWAHK